MVYGLCKCMVLLPGQTGHGVPHYDQGQVILAVPRRYQLSLWYSRLKYYLFYLFAEYCGIIGMLYVSTCLVAPATVWVPALAAHFSIYGRLCHLHSLKQAGLENHDFQWCCINTDGYWQRSDRGQFLSKWGPLKRVSNYSELWPLCQQGHFLFPWKQQAISD